MLFKSDRRNCFFCVRFPRIQMKLLDDTLSVIDMEGKLTGTERRVGDFDCIWDDGPVLPETTPCKTWLTDVLSSLTTGVFPASLAETSNAILNSKDLNSASAGNNSKVSGSTGNNQNVASSQSAVTCNSSSSLCSIFPIPRLNSYLGCLQMRRVFDHSEALSKQINQLTSRRNSHTFNGADGDLVLASESEI